MRRTRRRKAEHALAEPPAPEQDEDDETGALRRCIATGDRLDPALMVRFVVGPDNAVWPDIRGDLPGRGLWVRASRLALLQAMERRAFPRAAKAPVTVPADLPARTEALLAKRCLDWLGLARGAGLVRVGAEKVRAKLLAGRVAVLIEAADGSPAERAKMVAVGRTLPLVTLFDTGELGLALGRETVVHAALSSGRLTERFLADCARLTGFRAEGQRPDGPLGGPMAEIA